MKSKKTLTKAKIKDFRNHKDKKKNRAQAVIPTQKEIDIIVDQKILDKIERQKNLIEEVYDRIQIGEEMDEFLKQIESKDIKIQWFGMTAPIGIVKSYFRRWRLKYKKCISHENYLKQALRNDGLTDKQINVMIVEGKLYTDRKFLLAAEKKVGEKKSNKKKPSAYTG